jgi:hypothetical protein
LSGLDRRILQRIDRHLLLPLFHADGSTARCLQCSVRFKEQLLTAANEHLVRRRAKAREAEARRLPKSKGRRLKAYVLASVNNSEGDDEISTKLLVAGSMTAEAAEPIRRYFRERFPPFADDVGFDRAALVHAATEGLWFMDVLRLSPFSAKQRARLVKTILAVADGAPLAVADPE